MAPTRTNNSQQVTVRLPNEVADGVNTLMDAAEKATGFRPKITDALSTLLREALDVRAAAPGMAHEERLEALRGAFKKRRG